MENAQSIKHFYFGFAKYHVSDGAGDDVELKVNYKDNSYEIVSLGNTFNEVFRKELAQFATGLLKRKHHKDFALKTSDRWQALL